MISRSHGFSTVAPPSTWLNCGSGTFLAPVERDSAVCHARDSWIVCHDSPLNDHRISGLVVSRMQICCPSNRSIGRCGQRCRGHYYTQQNYSDQHNDDGRNHKPRSCPPNKRWDVYRSKRVDCLTHPPGACPSALGAWSI